MTFKEIQEEVSQRGFTDLFTEAAQLTRLKRWINYAYREILDHDVWPFLEANKEGTAPVTFTDLGHVLSVTNKTSEDVLRFVDRRTAVNFDPSLNDTGTATCWYMDGESSLRVFPLDTTSTLIVRYIKDAVDLSADADEPLIPASYQNLIVEGAVVLALKNRDRYEEARFVREEWERGVASMGHALLKPNYDREKIVVRTGLASDYL